MKKGRKFIIRSGAGYVYQLRRGLPLMTSNEGNALIFLDEDRANQIASWMERSGLMAVVEEVNHAIQRDS